MDKSHLKDRFHRIHNYLRISLTDKCNFRCFYCMPEENLKCLPQKELMSIDEIIKISDIFINKYQIKKIRLTGGEPLIRHDFDSIIQRLSTFPVELTLTSNGVLIDKHINSLKECNIHSINISLDTLNYEKFQLLSKRNMFSKVWNNILLLINKDFHVKINVVIIKEINDHEIIDFINLTKNLPLHIRFIEFMPFQGNLWSRDKVLLMSSMLEIIKKQFSIIKLEDAIHDTSKKFKVENYKGTFAFITTMSQSFCGDCNRIRLTADGKLKNCLFSKDEYDILTHLRNNKNIEEIITTCINNKYEKLGGQFSNIVNIDPNKLKNRNMLKIGG